KSIVVASQHLRPMQRRAGILQDARRIRSIIGEDADSHAGCDIDFSIVELKRQLERLSHGLDQLDDVFRPIYLLKQERKFIAVETRYRVALLDAFPKTSGHFSNAVVSECMAQRVINFFEAVERDKGDTNHPRIALRSCQSLRDAVLKEDAIGQTGHGVMVSKMLQLGCSLSNQFFKIVFVTTLLLQQSMMPQGPSHGRFDVIQVKRLHYVIERPASDCFDGAFNSLLTADHDDGSIGASLMNVRQEIQTADSGHVDIADYHVEVALLQHRQRLFGRGYVLAFVFLTQHLNKQISNLFIIV